MRGTTPKRAPRKGNLFEIAGRVVPPGSRQRIKIPVASLYLEAMVGFSVVVINGERAGPRLWVSAGIHGDELIGIEIVRRLLDVVEPRGLRGTLIAVPLLNAFGLVQQSRFLPDRRDLNRSFPGSRKGSLAARLANLFLREVVVRATHGIDLHTAAVHRTNLPQVRLDFGDKAARRLARAFGAPILVHAGARDGSLRQAASRRGIPTLVYEAGEALRHDAQAVEVGLEGVLRVMAELRMRPHPYPPAPPPLRARDTDWVRAPKSGLAMIDVEPGERVRRGQVLGRLHLRVHSDRFQDSQHLLRSPVAGLVIGKALNPLVTVGDALVHIARTR